MGRWYESEPRLVTGDFTHTTKPGSDRVARLFVGALRASRAAFAARGPEPDGPPGPAAKKASPVSRTREGEPPPS